MLGGSFDPIHHGHLRLAEEVREQLQLKRLLLIPARPWQRGTMASPEQRLAMVQLACHGNPHLLADGCEVQRAGASYTVETLDLLRARLGSQIPVWLVLGADAFLRLASWHQWERLADLCHIAVVPRPGSVLKPHSAPALARWWQHQQASSDAQHGTGRLVILDLPQLDISATAIRALVAAGRSPRYLLPDPVLDYIEIEGIYLQEGHGP